MTYPGGAETPYALGQTPDVDAAITAGNAASAIADPNAVGSAPQQTTIPAATDPTRPARVPGMNGGVKLGVKPANYGGQRMVAQDFVPHPDPYTIVDDGHSFSRAAFNLPAPAIAARLQGLTKENEELNKLTGEVFKQDTKEVVPPQYSRSYNGLWDRGDKEYRASILAQYGGRQDLAAKAIAGKDSNNPEAHRGYLRFNRDMNEVGRIITHDVAEAERNIEDMQTNKIKFDQQSFDASQELVNAANSRGSEGLGDIQALMKAGSDYKRAVTLPYFLAQKDKEGASIDDHVKNFMASTFAKNTDGSPKFTVGRDGVFRFLYHTDLKTAEKMIDNLAEEIYPQFRGDYLTKDAFKERLRQWYPMEEELKVDDKWTPPASGSGGAAKDAGYSRSYQEGSIKTEVGPAREYGQVPLAHLSAGKGKLAAPNQFFGESGREVFMHPTAVVADETGKKYLLGKVAKEPGTTRVSQDEAGNITFEVQDPSSGKMEKASEIEYFNQLEDRFLPYERNKGGIENTFPGLTEQSIDQTLQPWYQKQARGGNRAASTQRAPASGSKTASSASIRSLVGKPGYEEYTEQELLDYYRSQGYKIQ